MIILNNLKKGHSYGVSLLISFTICAMCIVVFCLTGLFRLLDLHCDKFAANLPGQSHCHCECFSLHACPKFMKKFSECLSYIVVTRDDWHISKGQVWWTLQLTVEVVIIRCDNYCMPNNCEHTIYYSVIPFVFCVLLFKI